MGKKQLGAAQDGGSEPAEGRRLGRLERFRALPGFRMAAVAFVLTVVLGVGSTIAYAYWSQNAVVSISGTTRAEVPAVPAGTTLATGNPVMAVRPGRVTGLTCKTLLSHEQMKNNTFTDIRFSWPKSAGSTSYAITVRSNSGRYSYQEAKTVTAESAVFRFLRQGSNEYGEPKLGDTPFYTDYTIRIMPMTGATPGDPLYRTLSYAHWSSANCHDGLGAEAPLASPVGSVEPVDCALQSGTGKGAYSDLALSWSRASNATAYSVRVLNEKGYGAETSVTGTGTVFRIQRPASETGAEPFFGNYTVRVQPMAGSAGGDPQYRTLRFQPNSFGCSYGSG